MILIFAFLTLINAYFDYRRIKANKPIIHGLEYGVFLALCIGVSALFGGSWLHILFYAVVYSTIARTALFNFTLYTLRGLPITYTSSTTTSFTDRLLNRWGVKFWWLNMAALVLLIYLIKR